MRKLKMILEGDCREMLPTLQASSVHACITSPPYWRLRDYGLGAHQLGLEAIADCLAWTRKRNCASCYVCRLVLVFQHVKRVLRGDGLLFLVIGDSYHYKQLCGIPWRVALALQADGWVLRSSIIWAKANPLPESVRDRCTRSHEHVLMLSKARRYYFDMEAIKEPNDTNNFHRRSHGWEPTGRHKRDVWYIANQALKQHHFAAFPPALIEPMILAGTSETGVCGACGAPWQRQLGTVESWREHAVQKAQSYSNVIRIARPSSGGMSISKYETIGWQASCTCHAETIPATVLDPFAGAGTVALVAERLGRQHLGIEANPDYIAIANERLATWRHESNSDQQNFW